MEHSRTPSHSATRQLYRLRVYLLTFFTLVAVGTLVYENIEGWAFVDAFYFSIVTLATVGYGDHYPITTFGKLFTSAYILVGVSLFLLFINELSRYIHNEK